MTSTVFMQLPVYQFHSNLIICPLPSGEKKIVTTHIELFGFNRLFQGKSCFFILKQNGTLTIPTGKSQKILLLPNCMYCFLPSFDADHGLIKLYDHVPQFLKKFKFLQQINEVRSCCTKSKSLTHFFRYHLMSYALMVSLIGVR